MGRFTDLSPAQVSLVQAVGGRVADPLALCRAAQGLLRHPMGVAVPAERLAEQDIRPAAAIVDRALELDRSALDRPRAAEDRVIGTCRHFAVVATAFLSAGGVPARARCGFGGYFEAGRWTDHWITEWWDGRWVRTDVQWLDAPLPVSTADLPLGPGSFLTAGEAWQLVRSGGADGACFGVAGTSNWGPGEIRANVMRDLATLEGVEVLPWDVWGPMEDSYEGRTGADFDELCDEIAVASASDADEAVADRRRLLARLGPMALG